MLLKTLYRSHNEEGEHNGNENSKFNPLIVTLPVDINVDISYRYVVH